MGPGQNSKLIQTLIIVIVIYKNVENPFENECAKVATTVKIHF